MSEGDDLEYHVTFPTPTPVGVEVDPDEALLRERDTAVVLIGWMNSHDKYLAKYSSLYEKRGCTTIRYSPTAMDIMKPRVMEVARKILELILDMNLSDNPVLFHVFSNGGSRIYRAMREVMQSDKEFREIPVLGVVFDSTPGQKNYLKSSRALFAHRPPTIFTSLMIGFTTMFFYVTHPLTSLWRMWNAEKSLYQFMLDSPPVYPELYLYSKADELVYYGDIDHLIEHRKAMQASIISVCWDDSPHVNHLKLHEREYVQSCFNHLKKCLRKMTD